MAVPAVGKTHQRRDPGDRGRRDRDQPDIRQPAALAVAVVRDGAYQPRHRRGAVADIRIPEWFYTLCLAAAWAIIATAAAPFPYVKWW